MASLCSPIPFGLPLQEISNHLRCLHLIFVSYLLVSELATRYKTKIRNNFVVPYFLRRERDSNPRYLSVRRFSRPVQSTTLPPLLRFCSHENVVSSRLMMQRYAKKTYHARKWEKNFEKIIFSSFALPENDKMCYICP